jgi:F-type H+-transporting ATPase subunit b
MFTSTLPLADIVSNLEDAGNLTGWNTQQFFSQCFAFAVLFTALYFLAGKKVRVVLEQRRSTIEKAMADAEQIKKALADAEASRLAIIQKANEQANAIIGEAEKSAVLRGEQRTQEAIRQAEEIVKKAREAAVLERDRLLAELKREIGTLVIQTTEKVAGKVLTADDQARLNTETQRQLGAPNN